MNKKILISEEHVEAVTQEVRKTLQEYLNDEIEIRVRQEVKKEVSRIFRELGRM